VSKDLPETTGAGRDEFVDDTILEAPRVPSSITGRDPVPALQSVSDIPTLPSGLPHLAAGGSGAEESTTQPDRPPVLRIDTVPDGPIELHLSKLPFDGIPGEEVTDAASAPRIAEPEILTLRDERGPLTIDPATLAVVTTKPAALARRRTPWLLVSIGAGIAAVIAWLFAR
jgi:hypothetical protein